jgi:hypothetical protein
MHAGLSCGAARGGSAIRRVPPVSEWNTIRSVLIRAAEQDTVDDRM